MKGLAENLQIGAKGEEVDFRDSSNRLLQKCKENIFIGWPHIYNKVNTRPRSLTRITEWMCVRMCRRSEGIRLRKGLGKG